MAKKKKQKVRLRRLNWDVEFYIDIIQGRGFVITEPAEVSLNGTKQKSLYGPQSPLFGTSYEDEQAFIERYRCQCGSFKGRQFEGEICPVCGHKVEYKDSDINFTGWIQLGRTKIISPYYYNILLNAIGKRTFPEIIYDKYKITVNGRRIKVKEEDLETKPLSPYAGLGIESFYDNYETVINYFKNTKKNKSRTFDLLLKQKDAVFTSHIPIPSTLLRPQSVTTDTFYYTTIDALINTTFTLSESLKKCIDVEKEYIIQRIQKKVNQMWNIYFEELNGKEGLIRGEMLGGSLNFTSRNVIVPDPTLHDNEVDLSYHTFLEVFKYKIIYYLMKLDDITLSKAYAIWKNASKFSDKVYDVMQYIIEKEDVRLLINRNPTLNFYSMLLMKVRRIKPDGNDYSLSVPLSIKLAQLRSTLNSFNCWKFLLKLLVLISKNLIVRDNQHQF